MRWMPHSRRRLRTKSAVFSAMQSRYPPGDPLSLRVGERAVRRRRLAAEHGPEHADHDDSGDGAAGERSQGCEQHELGVLPSHPFARSTTSAVNGRPPLGVTSNDRPQCPTITSAGALRSYSPGPAGASWYSSDGISMSSIAKVTVTSAPLTGLPSRVMRSSKSFGATALFGEISTWSV